jgi:hypothetical protein
LVTAVVTAPVEPAVVIPVDPESLDATRPVDMDVCSVCGGLGGYPVPLPLGEWDGEECWACGGTGVRGVA